MSTLIIAEAGVNHNGDINIARWLVEKAKWCGADIVKYQTFNSKMSTFCHVKMAEYQKINTGKVESQEAMLEKLTLSQQDYVSLRDYCEKLGSIMVQAR